VPCSRATGKLLFPDRAVRDWIAGASSGGAAAQPRDRPPVFLGSHDPLLDWALRESRCGLAMLFDGSLDGVGRFADGAGVASGLHIYDRATEGWNVPHVAARGVGDTAVLIGWATRQRGLVVRPEHAPHIRGLDDLAGRRVVHRQAESGTHGLFRALSEKAGLDDAEMIDAGTSRSEADAVMAVAQGQADAAFGLETLARPFGLHFVPVVAERFDLLVDRKAWFDPPLQRFMAFCQGADFARHARDMPGYDTGPLGTVRWNGERPAA
jgi:molybdate-binding protein